MKIVVCIKPVPESSITMTTDACTNRNGNVIMNPLCRAALEYALKLRDQKGGSVHVISMAPKPAEKILRESIALGADSATLLTDPLFAGADSQVTAKILSDAIYKKFRDFDLIVCGWQSTDGSTAQVPSSIAQKLNVSYKLDEFSRTRSVVIISRINNTARFPSVAGILKSESIKIEQISAADLGIYKKLISPTRVLKSECHDILPRKSENINAKKLKLLLSHKATQCENINLPLPPLYTGQKSKRLILICAENDNHAAQILNMAKDIGDCYRANIDNVTDIADAWAILFPSTMKSRLKAPFIASKLNTGISADCRDLYLQDNRLIVRRTTFSGRITADIACDKNPQIATMRVRDKSEIIFAGGRGLGTDGFKMLRTIAKKYGATVGGSRVATDLGLCDYGEQIGESGKIVSPKIYVAFGISGAAEHLDGIMESDIIISVNTDENAPINKYADYKIIGDAKEVLKWI